jgi:hypothetical protein
VEYIVGVQNVYHLYFERHSLLNKFYESFDRTHPDTRQMHQIYLEGRLQFVLKRSKNLLLSCPSAQSVGPEDCFFG